MTSCLIWEGFRGCQQHAQHLGGCGRDAPGAVGGYGDSHSFHHCQLPHFSQGTGQILAVMQHEAAAPKAASALGSGTVPPGLGRPHGLAGLPVGTKPLCQQLRLIIAFSLWLGGHQAAPGNWMMGVDAAPGPICNMDVLLQSMGMWLSTGRGWGLVSRCAILLCESLPGK